MNFDKVIAQWLHHVRQLAYPEVLPLADWHITVEGQDEAWQRVTLPASWGGDDQTVWWHRWVSLPPGWTNRKIALRMDIPEGLLFLNRRPYQGIDAHHPLVVLPADIGSEFTLDIQAYSGRRPEPQQCRFSELVVIDPQAEQLLVWLEQLRSAWRDHPWVEAGLRQWLAAMETHGADFGQKLLAAFPDTTPTPATPQIYLIGHSHLDVVWLWTHRETRRKVGRTFSIALNLIREFPEFCFCQGQAQLYVYCREDYPELYQQIQQQVQAGRWQVEGGVWVEPDGNLISGESWVRQLVYGQRFFRREFGVQCRVLWLPDTFGYQGNLPQLLKQAGIDYFFTTKLNWNDTQEFPYDAFWWQGIDGSRVLAHQPPVGLEGLLRIQDLTRTGQQYAQKAVAPVVAQTFGYGDGGGGVTREELHLYALLQRLQLPFPPKITSPLAFFQALERYGESLPVWPGELYLEKHRGTYTTHSWIKQWHRQAEREFYITEYLATHAWLRGHPYPQTALETTWQLLLLQQFHDILPGTFIAAAYPQIQQDFAQILTTLSALRQQAVNQLRRAAVSELTWTIGNSIHARDHVELFLPVPRTVWERYGGQFRLRANGQVIPHQVLPAGSPIPSLYPEHHPPDVVHVLCHLEHLPAYSTVEVHLEPAPTPLELPGDWSPPSGQQLENSCLRLTFDDQGNLTELWDQRLQRNLLAPGQVGAEIKLFLDRPKQWEAWDIDADYTQYAAPPLPLLDAQVVERGIGRQGVAFRYQLRQDNGLHCHVKKLFYLYRDAPFVECFVEVDLTQNRYAPFILKLLFPFDLASEQATFDIPFGWIQRPTEHPAQFEVPALSWADLSQGDWGVALLSRDKYGFSVDRHAIGLTLLRVAHYPHPQEPWHLTDSAITDTGIHQFCCRLYPHQGSAQAAAIPHRAQEFLYPPLPIPGCLAQPLTPLFTLNAPNIITATVKKAMDAEAIVVRLYEAYGQPTQVHIGPQIAVREIWECDLHEQPLHYLSDGTPFTLDFSPFGVKTLLLT